MEEYKDWGISAGASATAVQMVTWRLIRLIACATLVACHALPGTAILDFSLDASACHISIGGKQQRCNTRCVGCVREANFFRKTPRHTCARMGCSLSPAIPPNPPRQPPLSHLTQSHTAAVHGLQKIKRYVHQQPHPLHFERSLQLVSRHFTVLPVTVLSRRHLAACPGFKIKRQEGKKRKHVCDSNPLRIRHVLFIFWESLISVVSL